MSLAGSLPTARISSTPYGFTSGGNSGDYQNCSVLYCVLKLCTIISILRWAVLWIGFCLTGPISLCLDSFMFIFVCLSYHTAYVLYYCNMLGWTWWDWSLIFFQCFDTVGWSFDLQEPVPNMTCNVFGGMLSVTLLLLLPYCFTSHGTIGLPLTFFYLTIHYSM